MARNRFEQKLQNEEKFNQKSMDEYQQYMDEQQKFSELKRMKEMQSKLLAKEVLEQQIQEDNERKLISREKKINTQDNMTFGPKETDQTLIYQQLKKEQDKALMAENLKAQINSNTIDSHAHKLREIYMDKHNVNLANREVTNQNLFEQKDQENKRNNLREEWQKQAEQKHKQVKIDAKIEEINELYGV